MQRNRIIAQYLFAVAIVRHGNVCKYVMLRLEMLSSGFTAHEHIIEFDLINMNARLYDSEIGAFLSPDNEITFPENSQNYNRYSYALNNPLIYTDPSGNNPLLIIAQMAYYAYTFYNVSQAFVNYGAGPGMQYLGRTAFAYALSAGVSGFVGNLFTNKLLGSFVGSLTANAVTSLALSGKYSFKQALNTAGLFILNVAIQSAYQHYYPSNSLNEATGRNVESGVSGASPSESIPGVEYKVQLYEKFRAGSRIDFRPAILEGELVNGDQLGIILTANTNDYYSEVRFLQTVSVVEGGFASHEDLDIGFAGCSPFYCNSNSASIARYYGQSHGVLDGPMYLDNKSGIYENIPDVKWRATTSVIGLNHSNNWVRITSFQWGFDINSSGRMSVSPIQYNFNPSSFHINKIPKGR